MEENKMQTFDNAQFGRLRTLEIDGDPWFVGRDVAVALGYAKPENALIAHVDADDKTTTLIQSSGSNYKSNQPLSMNPAFILLSCPASYRLPSSLSAGLHLRYCPAFVKRAVTQTSMPHNLRRKAHDRNFSARVPRK